MDFDHTAKEVGSDGKVNSVKRQRIAGDEWLFEGPGTYIPRKEEKVLEDIRVRKSYEDLRVLKLLSVDIHIMPLSGFVRMW